ncbi:CocE/NonD family hydrolase [Leucobacter sp. G161]|uniref:CocE/NonD family hydrolase n=1 Tax=Leucobacter sp. G161 TaxID=663704 RepID=UPI00073B8DFB|nr:CocE/NonD family hydrolase [Leucobacter sp. G161]KUF06666.1 peptidase S15 [Leucobacter sp. G161]
MYDKQDRYVRTVDKDNMRIDWDVPIEMNDGIVLRCDVYRPISDGTYPVLMTYGPYGKGLHFEQGYAPLWNRIVTAYPEILEGTSGKYMTWETVDPEKWVPEGYVVIRVDSRGAGRSPGRIDCWSPRESQDFYDCIEWAGVQHWSNGKVGLLGISYYAMNQWRVAAMNPPHLAAICPFEGSSDYYREAARHGGIKHDMTSLWYPLQVESLQHGLGSRGHTSRITGELVSGPAELTQDELDANRIDIRQDILDHEWYDAYYEERNVDLADISVPLLSCGNWGGNALHLRGNIEGFLGAGSEHKWLEIHGLEHFTEFYTEYGRSMQLAFFDHFLKGKDTWHQAPVHLRLRNVDGTFTDRDEQEWPLARTQWTKYYLDADTMRLTPTEPLATSHATFAASGDGATFRSTPLTEELEITGPIAAKLFASSSTEDADVFVTLRVFDPNGDDVTFVAANDPHGLIATGWLRMSHRKLDETLSEPYRPWHPHDEALPVAPGEVYELDVEVWPTSVIVPAGYTIAVTVSGRDVELPGEGPWPGLYGVEMRGNGIYIHQDTEERVPEVFGGNTTLMSAPEQRPYVLLPVIPNSSPLE